MKEKWKHWLVLSEQSGFGWEEDKERYVADEYVWERLNKSQPRIIWHKTHIMPHRELLSEILHEAQATGKGVISSLDSTMVIDPRLLERSASSQSMPSPTPALRPKLAYNKSKKHRKDKLSDNKDSYTPAPNKKVDLGSAILALLNEIARNRKFQEGQKSDQEKAV